MLSLLATGGREPGGGGGQRPPQPALVPDALRQQRREARARDARAVDEEDLEVLPPPVDEREAEALPLALVAVAAGAGAPAPQRGGAGRVRGDDFEAFIAGAVSVTLVAPRGRRRAFPAGPF